MASLTDDEIDHLADRLKAHLPSKAEFEELRTEVQGIIKAWETATGLVAFVKWVSGIVAALTVIWAALTHAKQVPGT